MHHENIITTVPGPLKDAKGRKTKQKHEPTIIKFFWDANGKFRLSFASHEKYGAPIN